jgi:sugar-specific transcriptional regulator TrmB
MSTRSALSKPGLSDKKAVCKYIPPFSVSLSQKDAARLSKEWMLRTLVNLGFTETDAQVYVFLTTEGPQKARDIAEALRIYKWQLYRVLKNLQSKGIINASAEYPARFSAVLFEKVLDFLIKAKMEQQQVLQESKEELLATWRSITKKDSPDS